MDDAPREATTPTRRPLLGTLAAVSSAVLLVPGIAALRWYLWEVLVVQSGAPDRSMVFWGLPVVFLGFALFISGVGAAVLAWWWFTPRRRGGGRGTVQPG